MKKNEEDIPIKFWKQWTAADCIYKREKIEKLISANIIRLCKADLPDEMKVQTITTTLLGYFDDLSDFYEQKSRMNLPLARRNKGKK